jgi:DNA-binding NarL/FixJ family response regulator
MLIAGNRNGTLVNNYWTELDKLNRERAAEVIKLREKEQHESYDRAVKPYIKPATEAPRKKVIRKKYDHDLFTTHGEKIAELYKQGRSKRQIALHFGISQHTVKRIVVRLGLEKGGRYDYDK